MLILCIQFSELKKLTLLHYFLTCTEASYLPGSLNWNWWNLNWIPHSIHCHFFSLRKCHSIICMCKALQTEITCTLEWIKTKKACLSKGFIGPCCYRNVVSCYMTPWCMYWVLTLREYSTLHSTFLTEWSSTMEQKTSKAKESESRQEDALSSPFYIFREPWQPISVAAMNDIFHLPWKFYAYFFFTNEANKGGTFVLPELPSSLTDTIFSCF